MKKCPYCAGELEDTVIMCHHCGKSLTMYKKSKLIPAIILFGLCPFACLWLLFQGVSKGETITPMVLVVFLGLPLFCWSLLAWLIYLSKQPLKILTLEERQAKENKEGRQALIIAPFSIIAIMVFSKNYSNWILWTFLIFCSLGWIQFLPKGIKGFLSEITGMTFRGLWKILRPIGWILIVILLIWGVIGIFQGLAALSTTNFLLLLILWAILAQGEK